MKNEKIINVLCTCTTNYVPYALIALQTCKKNSPEVQAHLFVADGTRDVVIKLNAAKEFFDFELNIFIPDDISQDLQDSYLPCFNYYNAFEVSNVAKYVGLKHVITEYPNSRCIYIDTDVCFYGDIVNVLEQEVTSPIILSSHQFCPSTDDVESEYLLHGWINSGFSVFDGRDFRVHKVLDWLIHRIARRGYLATQYGLSGDQPWLSGVPFIFSDLTQVTKHDGINVAYWNIAERLLEEKDGELLCNGKKLIFFHFSGFVGAPRNRLSKHAELSISGNSILEKICINYQNELDKVKGLSLRLSRAEVLPCSKANLSHRINIGSIANCINIDSPIIKRGFFSRVGGRVDALISKFRK